MLWKYIACAFLMSAQMAHGQFTHTEKAKVLPTSELIERAKNYDTGAIRELGRRREKSAIEVLRKIAGEPEIAQEEAPPPSAGRVDKEKGDGMFLISMRNSSHLDAKVALARIGDKQYLDEFISGLSSSNGEWRSKCIYLLGEIGDARAVKFLIPILSEHRQPDGTPVSTAKGHSRHSHAHLKSSDSQIALHALPKILPAVNEQLVSAHPEHIATPDDWEHWWQQNKDSFGGSK